MTKLDLLKAAVGAVTGTGVSYIVGGIVATNVPQQTIVQKGAVLAGQLGIAAVVSQRVREHTDAKIDEAIAWYNENITKSTKKA